MRSKQGALGLLRRADHPEPVCMLLVAVGGRYVAVVSVRRAVLRESFRLRWLRLLAKSRPISLAVTSMIGRNVFKRKRGRAVGATMRGVVGSRDGGQAFGCRESPPRWLPLGS